jgi:DNA repair protein RecO (recombination protein O)
MQWTDDGIVLGAKRHGEASAIAELMTREHGRHLGLVRGGFGSKLKPVLQVGNTVRTVWRARLDEHLGHFSVEPLIVRTAAVLRTSHAAFGATHMASLARLLPERDPHPEIWTAMTSILDRIEDPASVGILMARFELHMLSELGFGLDLRSCASTGETDDLIYVSPKSGRAVSQSAGEPWRDKLLRLPAFLLAGPERPSAQDVADGFALTGYFLTRYVLEPRGLTLSDARVHFLAAAARA